jgi:hypothetical protein
VREVTDDARKKVKGIRRLSESLKQAAQQEKLSHLTIWLNSVVSRQELARLIKN